MTRPIAILADAGVGAGLGHLSRSSAVAVALRCRGIEARCEALGSEAAFERDGIAWAPRALGDMPDLRGHVALIDSYELPHELIERMAESASIVFMDDHGDVPNGAALIVSVAGSTEAGARRMTGFEYAALRPHFWGLPPRGVGESATRVLVTVGSGQLADAGGRIAGAIAGALPDARVTLVRGPYSHAETPAGVETLDAPSSLLEPLLDADLVVSAAGQTMLEATAAGTPCIALPFVDNQRRQAERLSEAGAVRLVDPPKPAPVADAVRDLAADPGGRRALSRTGQEVVDGYGALRVAFAISELARRDA